MNEHQRKMLDELITSLKQQRDELALKIHLGRAELKDEWNALNVKLNRLSEDSEPTRRAATEAASEVWESLKVVGEEIKKGFHNIRKSL